MGLEEYFGLEKRWFSGSMVYMLVGGCYVPSYLHDGCILYPNELWNIFFQYLKSPNALSFFRLFNPMFWPHATVLWQGVVLKETPNTAAICLVGEFEGILSTLRYPNNGVIRLRRTVTKRWYHMMSWATWAIMINSVTVLYHIMRGFLEKTPILIDNWGFKMFDAFDLSGSHLYGLLVHPSW